AEHAYRDDVVRVDLGREGVNVDDGLVAVRIPHVRVVFDHVVSHADHDVRVLEGVPGEVTRLEPYGSERELAREGHHTLAHEGVCNGDTQHFRESQELLRGTLPNDAVACQDDGRLCFRDEPGGLLDLEIG